MPIDVSVILFLAVSMKLIIVHDDPKVSMGRKWCLEAKSKSFLEINSTHHPNNRN